MEGEMRYRKFLLAAACTGFLGLQANAAPPADLSAWTVVQYSFGEQPAAAWAITNQNHTATQGVNADASYLRSDFVLNNASIDGTWHVDTTNDDDFMGFVFGEQDPNHYYLFDWKKADQNDVIDGFAQVGMSVKVVNRATGSVTAADLWPTAGGPNVTLLKHNSIPWVSFTDYQFHLDFTPGAFTIEVDQGATQLESWTVNDSTYTTGHFGFYNYSQDSVVYDGFATEQLPEPSMVGLAGLIGLGLIGRRRR
jgi:hypothetical protein